MVANGERVDPKERLAELHAVLVARVEQLVTSDDWTSFLTQSRRFHNYSPNNQELLAAQLVARGLDASEGAVASFTTWGRLRDVAGEACRIRKGERALWVYAPITVTRRVLDETSGDEHTVAAGVRGFKPVPVFHSSQLAVAPALATPPLPERLRGHDAPGHVWTAISDELSAAGFTVALVPRERGESWNGRTDFTNFEVRVQDDLDPPQRLKTLAHEWAHVQLGHADVGAGARRHVAEVEAESVAFLVMGTVGIDAAGYTIPYVTGWAGRGGAELVHATADRVLAATAKMVDRLEARLDLTLTPDPLHQATAVEDQPARHLRLVPDPGVADRGGLSPWQRLLDTVRTTLTDEDRAELASQPAPRRLAVLLAAAGFDTDTAVATFRDLGLADRVTRDVLTATAPFEGIGDPPAPLYRPADVLIAFTRTEQATRHPATGAGLIAEWARVEQGPFLVEPVSPHPPVA